MGISITDPHPGYVLDVTRLVSRAGRVMTGIDRVERAYLDHILTRDAPVGFVARAGRRMYRLTRSGALALADACDHGQAFHLRAHARPRWSPVALIRDLPRGSLYLSVGHANLSALRLSRVGRAGFVRLAMLHDTIPLDLPQTQRAPAPRRFARKFRAMTRHCDGIICNSAATQADLLRHAPDAPPSVVAPLGVTLAAPEGWPAALDPNRPIFVALGTIEPRKEIGFLLDLWDQLAAPRPQLALIGARGWAAPALLKRLDHPPDGVVELGPLPDAQVAAVLSKARALLWPSQAEGYGLPPIEAAARGIPVLARPGAAIGEILGNIPIYPAQTDAYSWTKEILRLAHTQQPLRQMPVPAPSWDRHFKIVFNEW